jgi:hypothetical protein
MTRTFTPDQDIPDLTGKVILVTGGKFQHKLPFPALPFLPTQMVQRT